MSEIIIKSQIEFNALPSNFDELTEIKIVCNLEYVNRTPKNSLITVSDSAQINSVYGSAQINYVYDSAQINYVYDLAQINSVSGSAQINSVYGSAQINSVSGSAQINYVSGSAQINYVSMNAIIRIISSGVSILEAHQNVVLVYQNSDGLPKEKDDTVIINRTKQAKFNLQNFIKIYGVEGNSDEKLILYKFVKKNYTDFYSGKIEYKIGASVIAPDWNTDNECGGGLHVGATIDFAKSFYLNTEGRSLKVEVAMADIGVHPNPDYPHKIKCKKLKVLEEI